MITTEKTVSLPDAYPLSRLGRLEELLFFDIETTGFSGESSQLYLIGCIFFRGGNWRLLQWFAERPEAETEVLAAFSRFLRGFGVLVHFNGDRFDIPYLQKRCMAHGLRLDLAGVKSVDIYKRIRPYRRQLDLKSLSQRSIEHFLGIFREDPYSGGELIEVYARYRATREDRLYDMLMLHNREDLEGMPLILPILNYPDFFENDFTLASQEVRREETPSGETRPVLSLCAKSDRTIPVPIRWKAGCGPHPCLLEASGRELHLDIGLCEDTLKHFYPDHQNYYYLPFEDMAIHKSVGEYVEKSARKKATPQTCYVKKQALFLPQPASIWQPEFKRGCKDRFSYVVYEPELFDNAENLNAYLRYFLNPSK